MSHAEPLHGFFKQHIHPSNLPQRRRVYGPQVRNSTDEIETSDTVDTEVGQTKSEDAEQHSSSVMLFPAATKQRITAPFARGPDTPRRADAHESRLTNSRLGAPAMLKPGAYSFRPTNTLNQKQPGIHTATKRGRPSEPLEHNVRQSEKKQKIDVSYTLITTSHVSKRSDPSEPFMTTAFSQLPSSIMNKPPSQKRRRPKDRSEAGEKLHIKLDAGLQDITEETVLASKRKSSVSCVQRLRDKQNQPLGHGSEDELAGGTPVKRKREHDTGEQIEPANQAGHDSQPRFARHTVRKEVRRSRATEQTPSIESIQPLPVSDEQLSWRQALATGRPERQRDRMRARSDRGDMPKADVSEVPSRDVFRAQTLRSIKQVAIRAQQRDGAIAFGESSSKYISTQRQSSQENEACDVKQSTTGRALQSIKTSDHARDVQSTGGITRASILRPPSQQRDEPLPRVTDKYPFALDHRPSASKDASTPRRSQRTSQLHIIRDKTPPPKQRWTRVNQLEPWSQPVVYPVEGARRVTVEFQDLERLDEGEFLNDTLISFALRRIENSIPEVLVKHVHFFNSYFYSTLCSNKGLKGFNYDAVKRWTKSTDLLSTDFVVVPINHDLHWFAAIICNLQSLDPTVKLSSPMLLDDVGSTGQRLDDLSLLDHETPAEVPDSQEKPEPEPSQEPPPGTRRGTKKRRQPSLAKFDFATPAIITLDSFGTTHGNEISVLKEYICAEVQDKRQVKIERSDFQGVTAKGLVEQDNFCDCGLFVIAYLEIFAKNPRGFVNKLLSRSLDSKVEFEGFNPSKKRAELRDDLLALYAEQEEQRAEKKRKRAASKSAESSRSDVLQALEAEAAPPRVPASSTTG